MRGVEINNRKDSLTRLRNLFANPGRLSCSRLTSRRLPPKTKILSYNSDYICFGVRFNQLIAISTSNNGEVVTIIRAYGRRAPRPNVIFIHIIVDCLTPPAIRTRNKFRKTESRLQKRTNKKKNVNGCVDV